MLVRFEHKGWLAMAWQDFLAACALFLILEGIMPFLSPSIAKRAAANVIGMRDPVIRFAGLTSMIAGVGLLYLVR